MSTSPITTGPSKPTGATRIPAGTLEYFQTRNRLHAFSVVQKEFQKSGISQVDLAARMGKGADRLSRLLGAPGNWTMDTLSDLLFAISGAEIRYELAYPLDRLFRNATTPHWLEEISRPPPQDSSHEPPKELGSRQPKQNKPNPTGIIGRLDTAA